MQVKSVTQNYIYNNRYRSDGLNHKKATQSFTGLLNWFRSDKANEALRATVFSNIGIYSPKELAKLRENVTREISSMFKMEATPGLKQRMKNLLYSPFVDYETRYFGTSNLADDISYCFGDDKGTELYRQFVLTSLADTMPLELLCSERKIGLTFSNKPLAYILDSYSGMDESSSTAKLIRKMVERLIDAGIPIHNDEYLCAKSILNNQPLMSKIYVDKLSYTPATTVSTIYEKSMYHDGRFERLRKTLGCLPIHNDPIMESKFFLGNEDMKNSLYGLDWTMYDYSVSNFSLYNLAGLSTNKMIRENLFDVLPWFKKQLHLTQSNGKYIKKRLYKGIEFLCGSEKYHPELNSVDFMEKYLMSYNRRYDIHSLMDEFPYNFVKNEQKATELRSRIEELRQQNNPANDELIERLSDLYLYMLSHIK